MPARDDHGICRRRQHRLVQPVGDRLDDDLVCVREALAVGELLAIVEDVGTEARVVGELHDVPGHVAGADDVEMGGRRQRIDVHVHLSSADEAVLLREVVVQVVVQEGPAPGVDGLARLPEGVVLVAAAADGAHRPSVGEHQHLGAGPLRCRSVGANDRHERGGITARQRLGGCRKDLLVQMRTSILHFCFRALMNSSAFCCFFCPERNCFTRSLTSPSGTVDGSLRSVTLMMWNPNCVVTTSLI